MTLKPRPWCVIGAGPSGLTALKNLLALGLPAVCLEREAGVGGNWNFGSGASSVFASTRLISSKTLTAYTDFPMPREWPAHPNHQQCLEYLRAYAAHWQLLPHIRPRSAVERVRPAGRDGGWVVEVAGQGALECAGLVIASGHNREPLWPEIPGTFSGRLLHACDYKSPTEPLPIGSQRVLVIGGGNSGCDIAVECSRHAAHTVHSTRRGYFVAPRQIRGRPADLRLERLLKMGLPLWLRRFFSLRAIDHTIGLPWRHGLPQPDHRLWEAHPVINDSLYECIDSGRIVPAGGVERFEGSTVVFADGTREAFDIVICATGYRLTLPWIAPESLCMRQGIPQLFLNMLHPQRDDIAICGLIQPDSGQWGLTDLQAQVIARMALARTCSPAASAWLYRQRQAGGSEARARGGIRHIDTPRHALEVEHFAYRRQMQRLIDGLDRRLRKTIRVRAQAEDCQTPPPAPATRD